MNVPVWLIPLSVVRAVVAACANNPKRQLVFGLARRSW